MEGEKAFATAKVATVKASWVFIFTSRLDFMKKLATDTIASRDNTKK